jgi:hypothetical protein
MPLPHEGCKGCHNLFNWFTKGKLLTYCVDIPDMQNRDYIPNCPCMTCLMKPMCSERLTCNEFKETHMKMGKKWF